ncbi:hypothetical protein F2Q70_00016110 [Brassica cretica]|uniref:Uncharacterized protein n=1 Tax=Brassica cretica TaxID=69181 RepID=A0A8S9I380_BRACR|nr:hypothetical protein F2Q70_00016110 [Brassica cretica]
MPQTPTGSGISIQNSRSEIPVASETFISLPPSASSPTKTNLAANSSPPPILSLPKVQATVAPHPSLPLPTPKNLAHSTKAFASTPAGPSLVERLRKSEDKTLSRLAPVSLSDSGRPRVLIPDTPRYVAKPMQKAPLATATSASEGTSVVSPALIPPSPALIPLSSSPPLASEIAPIHTPPLPKTNLPPETNFLPSLAISPPNPPLFVPETKKKPLLKRSLSIPNLNTFPSFMSQLAYFSSLPSPYPNPPFNPQKPPPLDSLSLPTSNSFDILATEGTLHPEGSQNS